ncbi:MAG: hypothetical protein MUP86_01175 [Dehalococcoidia bacterium]|nr:hypothetical protein [Dehalococcoidia bacterium]
MTEKEPIADGEPEEDEAWEPVVGDQPDGWTQDALKLAHRAIDRFPDLRHRYRRFAGPAAIVSTGIVLLAGMAITRRLRRGESPDEALEGLTSEEIENAVRLDGKEEE